MHNTLDTFKTDLNNNLPRQVRSVVQQIQGEDQGKWLEGSPSTPHPGGGGTSSQANHGALANVSQTNPGVNLSLQQPYYQTMAYRPNIPPMGCGIPHGPVPDVLFPRTAAYGTPNTIADGEMTDGVCEQIARTLREFGFNLKGCSWIYQKPYPDYFNTIPYPRGFRVLDFTKFTRDDARTMYEHVGQFLAQVNDVGIADVHKIRLFPLSLSSTAFNWFTSLASNSINSWPCLEQKFHDYFYNGKAELRLSDLTVIRQPRILEKV
jgi:hypothetical protein